MAKGPRPQFYIDNARQQLALARQAQRDITATDATRHAPGIYNAVVFGRSVEHILGRIKNRARQRFDAWFATHQQELLTDPLLKWFTCLRNQILKEGGPRPQSAFALERMGPGDMAAIFANRPPGAKRFIMGDSLGGNGWEIELLDGTTQMYYVALPANLAKNVSVTLHLPDHPDSHLGGSLPDTSIDVLVGLYLDYMERLIGEAEREFAGL